MIRTEKTIEMRGVARNEIVNYFISIDGKNMGSGNFIGENWEVKVSEENIITIGSLKISSVIVFFHCDQEYMEQMLNAFRLKFLSAGG